MQTVNDVIITDADILGGTPVFRSTRVAVRTLFDHLGESSLEKFLMGFPSVSREQAETVIEFAAGLLFSTMTRREDIAARRSD